MDIFRKKSICNDYHRLLMAAQKLQNRKYLLYITTIFSVYKVKC